MKNLKIQYKEHGRTYVYNGQDLTKSAWYIVDEDGNKYEDQVAYEKANKPKPAPKKKVVKKVEDKDEE